MNQKSSFNPDDLSNSENLDHFISMMKRESKVSNDIKINLKKTGDINLSQFNSLVSLYVYMSRIGKKVSYQDISTKVQKFTELTQFNHVFNR